MATDHEIGHGHDIAWTLHAKAAPEHIRDDWRGTTWLVEVTASGTRDGKPSHATHLFLSSLRTTPLAQLQLVRGRWSIEGWHWIRDTQLHQDADRYRGNGAGVKAALRTAALDLLRLAGFHSIRTGLQAVMDVITALLAIARRRPQPGPDLEFAEKPPESSRSSHQRELVRLICTFQRLRPPACADSGSLELAVGRRLATPLGNPLLMPPPSPV